MPKGKFVEIGIYEADKVNVPIEMIRYYFIRCPQHAEEIYREVLTYLKTASDKVKEN